MDQTHKETFETFKNSFYYGTRTDLNFKFLKDLSDEEAANFIQEMLWKVVDSMNDGNYDRIAEHISHGQQKVYSQPGKFVYSDCPFTPVTKPLSELRLGLITSSGHFVEDNDPMPFGVSNMTQNEALTRIIDFLKSDPELTEIPTDTEVIRLRVRHPGYDIRAAQLDPNVNFPITRLLELEKEGIIGRFVSPVFSFVGACAQSRLTKKSGPHWVEKFKAKGIEAALLVPS
ncbi:MAG: glycine/sarcosine/betaine reductase selenoprotein B family protein [Anaerolineales bacterium]